MSGDLFGESYGAADASAPQAAVTHGILREVLLVIVLGEIELRGVEDLRGDGIEATLFQLSRVHRLGLLRGFALRRRKHIDAGAILRARIISLPHALGRIVVLPERLEQAFIGNLLGI